MDVYEENLSTWNQLAEAYEDKFMRLDLYHDTYIAFCELLIDNAHVLELGSGPGNISRFLLDSRPDLNLLATDVAPNMVKAIKKNCPEATTMVLDVRDLDKLEKTFDAVVCGFILPYILHEDLASFFGALSRVCRSGAALYLSFVNGNPKKSNYQTGSTSLRVYFNYHSITQIKKLLNEHHFKIHRQYKVAYSKSSNRVEWHQIMLSIKV